MKRIFLFVDYREHFYSSVKRREASMDIDSIRAYFAEQDYMLMVKRYPEVDFRKDDFSGEYVLYQSSEDRDLLYKGFIEDIILGLYLQGAILVPPFHLFRAHHNKVFMEILRDLSKDPLLYSVQSRYYGTYEDFINLFPFDSGHPVVLKPAAGAMSQGVRLLFTASELQKHARKISRSLHLMDALKNLLKPYWFQGYKRKSNHRHKFVVQNYIPGLDHDFKVLIYGDKYYVLCRHNRKNDFRASGSGMFEWVTQVTEELKIVLDFALHVFSCFNVPYISLDIGCDRQQAYLFEMQFLSFGTTAIVNSTGYFCKNSDGWIRVTEDPILEREFVRSIIQYIHEDTCKL